MNNFRQLMGQLRRMGIQVKELRAKRVVVELDDKKIILENAEVLRLSSAQGPIYQILPGSERTEESIEISDEDIKFVAEQANVDEETARKYLIKHEGDIAKAIEDILSSESGSAEQ